MSKKTRETLEWDPVAFRDNVMGLKNRGARLVTMAGSRNGDGEVVLHYFFDVDGGLTTVRTRAAEGTVDSLFTLFLGADVVEREINSLFGVKFVGNPNLPNPGGEPM